MLDIEQNIPLTLSHLATEKHRRLARHVMNLAIYGLMNLAMHGLVNRRVHGTGWIVT